VGHVTLRRMSLAGLIAACVAAGCAVALTAGGAHRAPTTQTAWLSLPGGRPVAHDGRQVGGRAAAPATASLPRQLIVPDLIATVPGGVTKAQLARIRALGGVRAVLPIDGGEIRINGKLAEVLSATASSLRSWTPPETAANQAVWTDFSRGDLVTSAAAARSFGLSRGHAYSVVAAVRAQVPFGASALLGVPGVDAVVNPQRSAQLGLVKNVAVLINAPGAQLTALTSQVRSVLGGRGQVVRLVPVVVTTNLPVQTQVPTGVPTSYLTLYQESAAQYCPRLSWTVLAAIGEIESGNGTNDGPSSAGALGPMQFLPSTWATWGIDAFGQTGPPNIMNPLDAVPSAARMLCADGAGSGGAGVSQAIFDYNHATWYVNEVLALADEYAHEYG
jgi:hypothetical protein